MRLILITGKTGSGKNILSQSLSEKTGWLHIDIDKLCKTCYDDRFICSKVYEIFGSAVFTDGKVDTKKLGRIVFNDKGKMKILFDLTYDFVIDKIDRIIEKEKEPVILNYVLLPKTKYWDSKNVTKILVCSNDENRLNHLSIRDNLPLEYLKLREKGSLEYKKEEFDYIFENDYSTISLDNALKEIQKLIRS